MANIGIVVIGYNRVNSIRRVLSSLNHADYGDHTPHLIISIDKSKTQEVEKYASQFYFKKGVKEVLIHSENLGLHKHILLCGDLVSRFDALIVLEDDVTVAEGFYHYAQQTVEFYKNDDRIAGISLYTFSMNYQTSTPFTPINKGADVFFMNCAQSWGQIWMKKQWFAFREWYEKNKDTAFDIERLPYEICNWPKSSWLKYHTRYCIEQNKYFVYPYIAFSTNHSDAGTHVERANSFFQTELQAGTDVQSRLITLDHCNAVHYDGFFENKDLPTHLMINEQDVCIDFYGKKSLSKYRKALSTRVLPYKVLKSFTLSVRPYEQNIYYNYEGQGLFLYDLEQPSTVPSVVPGLLLNYLWRQSSPVYFMRELGVKNLIKRLLQKCFGQN